MIPKQLQFEEWLMGKTTHFPFFQNFQDVPLPDTEYQREEMVENEVNEMIKNNDLGL